MVKSRGFKSRLEPPEKPDPYAECFWCNEAINPDEDGYISVLEYEDQVFHCCMRDECVDAVKIEVEEDNMSIEEFKGEAQTYHRIMTKEVEESLRAEQENQMRIEQELHERGGQQ